MCLWRIQQILLGALSFVLLGKLSFTDLARKASEMTRHFFDSPRARIKQAPQAIQNSLQLARGALS